jgi:hypothetical protein
LVPIVEASFGIKTALLNIIFGVKSTLLLQYSLVRMTVVKATEIALRTESHKLRCKMHLSGTKTDA